jgi:DNA-binding NtrC family response regulator
VTRGYCLHSSGTFEEAATSLIAEAGRTDGRTLALVRLHVQGVAPASQIEKVLAAVTGDDDLLGAHTPGKYEVLLVRAGQAGATALLGATARRLGALGLTCEGRSAIFPRDGATLGSLREKLVQRGAAELPGATAAPAASGPVVDANVDATGEAATGPAMAEVLRLAARVAAGQVTVLLLGETGVGKEVMAARIHRLSPRASKPFLRINCANLSESLLESELFGHEAGAFTGAVRARPGLLEAAAGGTLFLDEIGDLPLGLQARVLRALEAREILPIGGRQPRPIDVRFIAATNRDLEADAAAGRFRADLFYRLGGAILRLPPLRERKGEVEGLAEQFLTAAARMNGRDRTPVLSDSARAALLAHRWPGNIRELRNVVERACLLCDGDLILVEHLDLGTRAAGPPSRSVTAPPGLAPSPDAPGPSGLHEAIDLLERQRILDALEQCQGNQSRAAALLGIARNTLLARIDAYGLPRPRKKARDDA